MQLLRAILLGLAIELTCAGISARTERVHFKIHAHFDVIDHNNLKSAQQKQRNVVTHEEQIESVLRRRLTDHSLKVRIVDQIIHGEEAGLPTSWIEAFVSISKDYSREEIIEKLHDKSTEVVLYYLGRVESLPKIGSSPRLSAAELFIPSTCFNNGVMLPNKTCVCRPYFAGSDCSSVVCEHTGIVTNSDRCSCPPGFLGRHCELLPCVPGVENSFDFSTRSLIYIISLRDSMGRDIQQIYEATEHLQKQHPEQKYSSFILTTFLAKGSTYSINTLFFRTYADFLKAIAHTVTSSDGSELQPTIAAVRQAISSDALMKAKSSIFVFTDSAAANASALDLGQTSISDETYVTKAAIYWGLKIFFFMTDSVDHPITSTTDQSYQIYFRLAKNTLGDVIHVSASLTLSDVFLTFSGYEYGSETIAVSSNYECSSPRTEKFVIDRENKNTGFFVYTLGQLTVTVDEQTVVPAKTVASVNIYAFNSSVKSASFSGPANQICSYKAFVKSLQSVIFGWTANSMVDLSNGPNVAGSE
ncbi:hypothetical protein L596_015162 [Steinernema carpocapsae]|uniref:EGF-like domain-containing protein n=1 Tax=Steinernema carpocapsae TaxID=34508 RepID=A0A4U5NFG1_STECR|nr:hypothetical protein L596_015162 [Steinernema carpocapsae]